MLFYVIRIVLNLNLLPCWAGCKRSSLDSEVGISLASLWRRLLSFLGTDSKQKTRSRVISARCTLSVHLCVIVLLCVPWITWSAAVRVSSLACRGGTMNKANKVSQKQRKQRSVVTRAGVHGSVLRPWMDSLGHCIEPPEENRKKPTLAPPYPPSLW